jgi:hypothetical protein
MQTNGLSRTSRPGLIAGGVISSALALATAACGSSTPSAAPAASASSSHHAMASHHPMAESARFGSDCGMVPTTGMGSFHGMAMDPVVTAASHNPLLTTLAKDIKTTGLAADLNSMHTITVFAPQHCLHQAPRLRDDHDAQPHRTHQDPQIPRRR